MKICVIFALVLLTASNSLAASVCLMYASGRCDVEAFVECDGKTVRTFPKCEDGKLSLELKRLIEKGYKIAPGGQATYTLVKD